MQAVFKKVKQGEITKAIVSEYFNIFNEIIDSDVIIVGAGPSGLMAGARLAEAGKSVAIIEYNNYLGGGFWVGGCYYNQATFRDPSQNLVKEIGVDLKKYSDGIYIGSAPHICSSLIKFACDKGVKILNLMMLEDLMVENGHISGVVVNWSPTQNMPKQISCLDPLSIPSKIVIDATGHKAAAISKLADRDLINIKGDYPMNVNISEDEIVEYTGKVYESLYACGMSLATLYGLHRMGPTFGAMLMSGEKVAKLIIKDEF